MKYLVQFIRGDSFEIEAESSTDAYRKCREQNPECEAWDVNFVEKMEEK